MRKILLSLSVIFILLGLSGCNMSIFEKVTKWEYKAPFTDGSGKWLVEFTLELNETAETYILTSKSDEVFGSGAAQKHLAPIVEKGTAKKYNNSYFFTSSDGNQYEVIRTDQYMELSNFYCPAFDENGNVGKVQITKLCKFEQVD